MSYFPIELHSILISIFPFTLFYSLHQSFLALLCCFRVFFSFFLNYPGFNSYSNKCSSIFEALISVHFSLPFTHCNGFLFNSLISYLHLLTIFSIPLAAPSILIYLPPLLLSKYLSNIDLVLNKCLSDAANGFLYPCVSCDWKRTSRGVEHRHPRTYFFWND